MGDGEKFRRIASSARGKAGLFFFLEQVCKHFFSKIGDLWTILLDALLQKGACDGGSGHASSTGGGWSELFYGFGSQFPRDFFGGRSCNKTGNDHSRQDGSSCEDQRIAGQGSQRRR